MTNNVGLIMHITATIRRIANMIRFVVTYTVEIDSVICNIGFVKFSSLIF